MRKRKRTSQLSSWLLVAAFLSASVIHVLDRILISMLVHDAAPTRSASLAFGSTALFVINLAIYVALVLSWVVSVRMRLLPSKGRRYMTAAAVGMLLFLLVRAVKYRLAEQDTLLEHWCWYAYYVPLLMIPTSFLQTCISMDQADRVRRRRGTGLWIVFAFLLAVVLTNDLHHLMFRPHTDVPQNGAWGTYDIGPLWYLFYGYLLACVSAGFFVLAKIDRRQDKENRILPSVVMPIALMGMMALSKRLLSLRGLPIPWAFPETAVIISMIVYEGCIRSRLIPYNENYIPFFQKLEFPACITDTDLRPAYQSAIPITASTAELAASLRAPIEPQKDILLYGKPISAGYVFWTSNEQAIREINETLTDIAESLERENDLIRYENQQKEERARLQARNRFFVRAAQEVYPTQREIASLIERTSPGSPDFADNIARILLLNTYVKRKTNLLLLSSERDTVPAFDLFLALEETARFLSLCGIHASVVQKTDKPFCNTQAIALYDSFEAVAEALPARTKGLLIVLSDDALHLTAGCETLPTIAPTPADVQILHEDGQLFIAVPCVKEDAQ